MIKTAILTISDKGSKGERTDITGPSIKKLLNQDIFLVEFYKIIPDEIDIIEKELIILSDELNFELILTNGGTGFSQRDVTPEATERVITKKVPGIAEAMRLNSLKITPKAMLSRAISGIRNNTLIVNLPGSPKAATENLEFIMDALPHGIEILNGTASECARK
ncbi:MogA/MoaB family molybdenum cofactor biosynthesis protein [Clostridium grantii]|uniref:Molybdopterin adenylyltransferase n=1 Tax=Clostridium grantii DSM 8605 TaxID=1121316 RepID=A0A1M5WAK6_9CLOT|nr:MogA/MoaB family molybdenum cofactor biosynthesis protein [Clostridium grantii]SHH84244.1 molybdopterin adenylyltransferase [Clostridium grantii DSM 8605]